MAQASIGELAERALELARARCESAEVYGSTATRNPVGFQGGKLKAVQSAETSGLALRVVHNGRMGFATTTKLGDADGIAQLVQHAIDTAPFGQPVEFGLAQAASLKAVRAFDEALEGLDTTDMLEAGQAMVESLQACDPRLQASASIERTTQTVAVATSPGFMDQYKRTALEVECSGELTDGENMVTSADGFVRGCRGDLLRDAQNSAAAVVRQLVAARTIATTRDGAYTVVFGPVAVADVVAPIIAALSGRAVAKGVSPWRTRVGEVVVDPRMGLVDDPTEPYLAGSCPFDDEGTPTSRTHLLRDGCVQGFYTDLRAAAQLGCQPTGHGVRERLGLMPSPGLSALAFTGGQRDHGEILKGIEHGVLIQLPMGAWAGNPYAGDVSGNIALGFLIEGGRLVGRIKDCLFSVNAFGALKSQLVELSSDTKCVDGMRLPYAVIDGVRIHAST